jgi:biotin carboxyl carrier protein
MLEKRLQELLEFAKTTDLQELLWEKDGATVHFRRQAALPARRTATGGRVAPSPEPSAVSNSPEPTLIRSTMVGTFYRSDTPQRPPLVVEGTVVAAGQPVASIEAMKIRKDVLAPIACRIVKALVENAHPVEYGQPLFEVEVEPERV